MDPVQPASFVLRDIRFSHWDFNIRDGWNQDNWLATSLVEASNLNDAYKKFTTTLAKIVPRIALISQCYVQYLTQPFLVRRTDSQIAFVKYISEAKPVGLMFREKDLNGLNVLLDNCEIPEEFYYYWNDAVNSIGYSPKLLLMFSAIEALVKIQQAVTRVKRTGISLSYS